MISIKLTNKIDDHNTIKHNTIQYNVVASNVLVISIELALMNDY